MELRHFKWVISVSSSSTWLTHSVGYVKQWQPATQAGHILKGKRASLPFDPNQITPSDWYPASLLFFSPQQATLYRDQLHKCVCCPKFEAGQRATGTGRRFEQVTHPNKVAYGCLYRRHRRRQFRNSFPINFTFFVHYDQMGYLLGHRLQDTFYRFRVEHRHGHCLRALSERKI